MKQLDTIGKLAWAELPTSFRRIRLELARESLELAREKGHPEGSASIGYILVAPIDSYGRIDVDLWRQYHEFCRVVRFRPGEADEAISCASPAGPGRFDTTWLEIMRTKPATISVQIGSSLEIMSRSVRMATCILSYFSSRLDRTDLIAAARERSEGRAARPDGDLYNAPRQ